MSEQDKKINGRETKKDEVPFEIKKGAEYHKPPKREDNPPPPSPPAKEK